MVGFRTVLIACTALVLLVSQAVAQERCSFEFDEPNTASQPSTLRMTPSGRQVRIYRGPVSMVARAPASLSSSVPPPMAPIAEDDSDRGPSLHTAVKKVEDHSSPFADEAPNREECDQCDHGNQCDHCAHCGMNACGCECMPFWAHRDSVFGESLFLRPRGVDMAYAVQQDGNGPPGGRVGVVDPVFSGGFRVGFSKALEDCSSIVFGYTNFQSHAFDTIAAPRGGSVSSLVLEPGPPVANSTNSLVTAGYDIDFQLADVDYRRLLSYGPCHDLDFTLGLRYGNLRQFFQQTGNFTPQGDTIHTNTNIRFEGLGLKTGLDGERRIANTNLSVYGKSFISVLFGEFNADYSQLDRTDATVQAASRWNDERALPILEFEIGIRWTSPNGRWRSSTGYYTAYWFNTVATPQYVQAVQTSNFVHLGETITFDGIVSRLEYCY